MPAILMRWLILTIAIIMTSYLLDGIRIDGVFSAIFSAALLGILNAFFRPILIILTLPINILSLGLFTFVINALLLLTAGWAIPGFTVSGFWAALFGSLLISLVSFIINTFIGGPPRSVVYLNRRTPGRHPWE
jgi:putative membrane protein